MNAREIVADERQCTGCTGRGLVPCGTCVRGFSELRLREMERRYGVIDFDAEARARTPAAGGQVVRRAAVVELEEKPAAIELSRDLKSASVRWNVRYLLQGRDKNSSLVPMEGGAGDVAGCRGVSRCVGNV